MRLDIYHHIIQDTEVLDAISAMEQKIMALLDQLVADVAAEDTVIDSVVTLLTDIKAKLDAAGTDQTKLAALSADIQAQTKKMADAVVANTPAA